MSTSFLPQIKHIVHLMLENRSLDNVLGWLYANQPPLQNIPAPPSGSEPSFDGLNTGSYTNPIAAGGPVTNVPVLEGAPTLDTPNPDPGEDYEHVRNQVFGTVTGVGVEPPYGTEPTMNGFAADYHAVSGSVAETEAFMSAYTPAQLPMLNGLALNFAVSDRWYSSVPTQTNANRAYSLCGTSLGAVDNTDTPQPGSGGGGIYQQYLHDTIFNVLTNLAPSVDWTIFYSAVDIWPPCFTVSLFPNIEKIPGWSDRVQPIANFLTNAAAGTLGAFSYVEPAWGLMWEGMGTNGNDYHPPCNLEPGEQFLEQVYEALTANADAWRDTLLIITFDEHGGTFDHSKPPWTGCTPPDDIGSSTGFQFNRFGVRVPTILVSPWVPAGVVFRSEAAIPYDHTSVLAFIMKWADLDPTSGVLGARVAVAPTFEGVLCEPNARTDIPVITASPPSGVDTPPEAQEMGGHELSMLPLVAHHLLRKRGGQVTDPDIVSLARELRAQCRTRGDLAAFARNWLATAIELPNPGTK